MDELTPSVLVLGIGNLLWADEGFGVRCAEVLAAGWDFPASVRVMDGGTQGLYLLPYVQSARRMVVFDAIDYGLEPGTLREVIGKDVPMFMGAKKMSLHQTGFQEVLASAALLGQLPEEIVLIGVQPAELDDYGGSLRPAVRDRIPEALALALEWLSRWGVPGRARTTAPEPITDQALEISRYEAGRPSPEMACRFGDLRFIETMLPSPSGANAQTPGES